MSTNLELKAHFGSYLNLAQHNAYLIINHINSLLGKEDVNEGSLPSSATLTLLQNGKPEDKRLIVSLLVRHFPFLRVWISEDADVQQLSRQAETVYFLLHSALTRLNEERNLHSHWQSQANKFPPFYYAKSTNISPQQAQQALLIIRDYFINWLGTDDSTQREIAKRKYPELSNKIYKELIVHLSKPHQQFWQNTELRDFSNSGLIFFICLFLDKKQAVLFLNKITGFKDTRTAKERMVRAMYLHNCCRLPNPKLESSDVLLDMLNELSRCPEELYKLLSEDKKEVFHRQINEDAIQQTSNEEGNLKTFDKLLRNAENNRFPYFALRYLDEVNAFPNLRFQLYLGKLVQQKYEKEMLEKDEVGKLVKEKSNRLIVKDLQVFAKLSEIKQFDLEKLTGWKFYQMHDKSGNFNEEIVKAGEIVQFSPQYNFSSNRIAFKLGETKFSEIRSVQKQGKALFIVQNDVPDAIISIYELQNMFLYHHLHPKVDDKAKTAPLEIFIKRYIGLFRKFIQAVQNETFRPIELPSFQKKKFKSKFLKEKRINNERFSQTEPYRSSEFDDLQNRRELLQQKLDSSEFKILKVSYLPDDIRDYLLQAQATDSRFEAIDERNKPDDLYRFAALSKLDHLKFENNELLQKVKGIRKRQNENADNEPIKTLKAGNIAIWLVRDLFYLKPLNLEANAKNYDKPNDLEYNRLQNLLAFFQKDDLQAYFREYKLIDSKYPHPFLAQIDLRKCPTLLKFYEEYLIARKQYLIKIYADIDGKWKKGRNKNEKVALVQEGISADEIEKRFKHLFAFKRADFKAKPEKNYNDLPIMLPRGLFNEAINQALGLNKSDNPSFAIANILERDTQDFYHFDRFYSFKRSENQIFSENDLIGYEAKVAHNDNRQSFINEQIKVEIDRLFKNHQSEKAQVLKKFRDYVLETEQTLRFYQTTDRTLWLMAKSLAKHRATHTTGASVQIADLENHQLAKLDELLNKQVQMSVNILADKAVVGAITETRKIKDYGDLRKFAKDRRLPNFMQYLPVNSFNQKQLEYALNYLEINRALVLVKAFELEEKIHQKYALDFQAFHNKNSGEHIDHIYYIDFVETKYDLQNYLSLSNNDKEVIIEEKEEILKNHKKPIPQNKIDQSIESFFITKLRDKIIHNEIPIVKEYLKNKIFSQITLATTDDKYCESVMQKLIETITQIYDDLINAL